MLLYSLKRLGAMVLTFLIIMSLAFFVIQLLPESRLADPNLSPAALEVLEARLQLDRPAPLRLLDYFGRAARLDFGFSEVVEPGVPVFDIIRRRLPVTLSVNLAALGIAVPVGTFLGVRAALGRGKAQGAAMVFMSVILVSVPSFVLAAVLRYFVAFRMGLAPILYMPGGTALERAHSLLLPIFTLSLAPVAIIARQLRAELVEAENEEYMIFAKAKGFTRKESVLRHGLQNAALPLVPSLAIMFAGVLAGSLVVERIFSIPGMGAVLVDSIVTRDCSLTMAVLMFFTIAELLILLAADLGMAVLDPRIRLKNEKS